MNLRRKVEKVLDELDQLSEIPSEVAYYEELMARIREKFGFNETGGHEAFFKACEQESKEKGDPDFVKFW